MTRRHPQQHGKKCHCRTCRNRETNIRFRKYLRRARKQAK